MQLWQYQALAEPINAGPETITLDKWFTPTTEPVRRAGRQLYRWPAQMPSRLDAITSLGADAIMGAVDQVNQPYLRHKRRQYAYPTHGAQEAAGTIFQASPPPQAWTDESVNKTGWTSTDPPDTNWTQTPSYDASDTVLFDDTVVTYDSASVLFDGADPALIDGSYFDPPNASYSDVPAHAAGWTDSNPPSTVWEDSGGNVG